MTWFVANHEWVFELFVEHLWLSLVPTFLGLGLALVIGVLLYQVPVLRSAASVVCTVVYTIPSLALFMFIPLAIGTSFIDPINVVIALTVYSTALGVRAVFLGLGTVDRDVVSTAQAIGYSRLQNLFHVQLPLAVPALFSVGRVVAVTNISLVTVGSLIGSGGLGDLFTAGYQRWFVEEILVGVIGVLLIAFVTDRVIEFAGWLLTPWNREAR